MYVRMYICMHVYIYVCMYICMHVYKALAIVEGLRINLKKKIKNQCKLNSINLIMKCRSKL